MATRYIPRSLRQQQDDEGDQETPSAVDGQEQTRRTLADLSVSAPPAAARYSFKEIVHHYGDGSEGSTFHDSNDAPGQLVYLTLFKGANPRWAADKIIFAKTHLDFLTGYHDWVSTLPASEHERQDTVNESPKAAKAMAEADGEAFATPVELNSEDKPANGMVEQTSGEQPASHPSIDASVVKIRSSSEPEDERKDGTNEEAKDAPKDEPQVAPKDEPIGTITPVMERKIAVFEQVHGGRFNQHKGFRSFSFAGYFRLVRIDFLQPGSPEVVRLLEQKWRISKRDDSKQPLHPGKERNPGAWEKSLNSKWAVLEMDPVAVGGEELEPPKIELLPDEEPSHGEFPGGRGRGRGRGRYVGRWQAGSRWHPKSQDRMKQSETETSMGEKETAPVADENSAGLARHTKIADGAQEPGLDQKDQQDP